VKGKRFPGSENSQREKEQNLEIVAVVEVFQARAVCFEPREDERVLCSKQQNKCYAVEMNCDHALFLNQ